MPIKPLAYMLLMNHINVLRHYLPARPPPADEPLARSQRIDYTKVFFSQLTYLHSSAQRARTVLRLGR